MSPISPKEIIAAIVGAIVGGSGIVGLCFFYIRHFIDKRLAQREAEDKKQQEQHIRRLTIEDEWKHATGRLFYHIHKYIVTGHHNGDLESAWEKFQEAEEKKKQLDREIVVENEMDI